MATDLIQIRAIRQEIVKGDLEINALIQDIRECVGPEEELDALNGIVKDKFQTLRKQMEELEKFAKVQDKESDKNDLLKEIASHQAQVASTQSALRKANVLARMQIDKLNRDILMSGTGTRQRPKRNKEEVLKTTTNITDSLLSVSRMMTGNVEQSELVLHTLAGSSRTLSENQEELKTMGSAIQQSHRLLTKYNRREFTDKVLIFIALAFFFGCVLYVVKKRIF